MLAAPAASRARIKSTRASHHRSAKTVRHSLRDGVTVSFVLAPETGLCCLRPPRDAEHHRKVDISVGISGPHDFAVRFRATRLSATKTSTASRPTFVTMANAPLSGGTGEAVELICPTR
jgi:hypothetical protein